jgi:hypothetical protein
MILSIKLSLQIAVKNNFLEFSHYKSDKSGKVYKIKYGIPYWFINKAGEIEKLNYRTHEDMNMESFKTLLSNEQILITNYKL